MKLEERGRVGSGMKREEMAEFTAYTAQPQADMQLEGCVSAGIEVEAVHVLACLPSAIQRRKRYPADRTGS